MTTRIDTQWLQAIGIRPDILAAQDRVWTNLGRPGTWLTGPQRVAIAAETRAAAACSLCQERKGALSPYAVEGAHDSASHLPEAQIDAIHRITTDPGRLTRRLFDELTVDGMSDAEYVEMLSVVCLIQAVDIFHLAVGLPQRPLPAPTDGAPSRKRPSNLDDIGAWVPVVSKRSPEAAGLFAGVLRISNIARALSLVPEAIEDQIALIRSHYLPLAQVASVDGLDRAVSRAQIELVASRVSALNECFY